MNSKMLKHFNQNIDQEVIMSDAKKEKRTADILVDTKIAIMFIPAFLLLVLMGIAMGSMTDSFIDYHQINQILTK